MSRGYGYKPGITIIVVVFNRHDLLMRCFDKIQSNTHMPYSMVVVENASDDGMTREWVRSVRGRYGFELVEMPANLGYGRGANIGSQVAEGELLCFLNGDTEPHDGWLAPLVAEFEDPTVGAAAGRLVNPDGSLQHAGVRLFYEGDTLVAANITDEQPAGDVKCEAGTAQAIRAEAFRESGMYDPRYRNGYEDVDLCLRLGQDGWRLRYNPASTVMHVQHGSGAERWTHVHDNIRRLQEDWAGKV